MFNLAEILTLIIGCLLALVFIDGVRRAIRIKRSKLKVDLIDTSSERDVDFEEEWQGYETQSADTEMSDEIQMLDSLEEEKDHVSNVNLNIIHLHDENVAVFSESSLSLYSVASKDMYKRKAIHPLVAILKGEA